MNKLISILALSGFALLLSSCEKDFTSIDVTYTKATALYADLNELRNITLIGEAREISDPGKIFVSNDLLLIGEEEVGIHIMDNSDPENPVTKSFINVPGNREFFVDGSNVYAESYYDMLKIDLSDINSPTIATRVRNAFGDELKNGVGESLVGFDFEVVTESFSEDDNIYEHIRVNETIYFDSQNRLIPESAVPASFAGNNNQFIGTVNRIVRYNDHVYVLGRSSLTVFNDQSTFDLVGTNAMGWQMETVFPFENKLFIGTQNSMEVFDISNPEVPQYISTFAHATSCDPVYPLEDVAYVTLRTGEFAQCPGDINALVVLDITDINSPKETQEIEMKSPYGMSLIGTRLFVGEGENGLKIFDAKEKTRLVLEQWDQEIQAYDIIPHPTRTDIVLIAGPDGLSQYDIESTNSIELLSTVGF